MSKNVPRRTIRRPSRSREIGPASKERAVVTNPRNIRTIFADGFGKISVVNNVVRLDLVEVEPVSGTSNQELQVARVMLPLNMMPALINDLSRLISQAGGAQAAPAPAAAAPQAAPAASSGMIPAPPLGPPPRWTPKS